MEYAVNLSDVRKSFGDVRAVDGLSLTIRPGETVARLDPNGASKSTTIGLLLGLSTLDSGSIELFGTSPTQAVRAGRCDAAGRRLRAQRDGTRAGRTGPRADGFELVATLPAAGGAA